MKSPLHAAQPSLAALARKYRRLIEIHQALLAWDDARAKTLDRALADEFPGALRELQTLPLAELKARRDALEHVLEGGPQAPWMQPMADYHALFRAALIGKQRLQRNPAPTDEDAARIAAELGALVGLTLDPAFVHALVHPPQGRLAALVLARLVEQYGIPAEALERLLFVRRRSSNAQLQ